MNLNFSITAIVLVACVASSLNAQSTRVPTNPKEFAQMRAYYDRTTWAMEIEAQKYEKSVVTFWDNLIQADHAWSALTAAPVAKVVLHSTAVETLLENEIKQIQFVAPSKPLDQQAFKTLLQDFEKSGFRVTGSEWKLTGFTPAKDGPALSTIAMKVHAEHAESTRRFVVSGNLHVTWSADQDAETKRYVADSVDASGVQVLVRKGPPVFTPAMSVTLDVDPTAKKLPANVDPIVIQDLNGDQLPEVILVGVNRVYWNRGKWRFAKKPLCSLSSLRTTSAVFADFTGDGAIDLLCGVRGGVPMFYRGTKDGQFNDRPTLLKALQNQLAKPSAMAVGDIDGDGDVDVLVTQTREGHLSGGVPTPYFDADDSFPATLLQNDGKGNFTDVTQKSGLAAKRQRRVRTASLVDLDQDSDLDLLLTSDFRGTEVLLNDGTGQFADATDSLTPTPRALGMGHVLADFNQDGKLDFLMVGVSSAVGRRLDAMELGRDDFPEHNRMRAALSRGNRLYLNESTASELKFTEAKFAKASPRNDWPWSATALDYDRDGDTDVFATNGQISGKSVLDYDARFWCHDIYFNAKDRPTNIIRFFAMRMRPAIGKVLSWHGFEHNALLTNTSLPDHGFVDTAHLMGCASIKDSRTAISGDLDLDGREDLIYTHISAANRNQVELEFLRNRSQDNNHWVGVHLVPNAQLRNTLGAQVTVRYGDKAATAAHVTGDVFGAQHSNTMHFGLGTFDTINSIEVKWPGGAVTQIDSPEIDRYHDLSKESQ